MFLTSEQMWNSPVTKILVCQKIGPPIKTLAHHRPIFHGIFVRGIKIPWNS